MFRYSKFLSTLKLRNVQISENWGFNIFGLGMFLTCVSKMEMLCARTSGTEVIGELSLIWASPCVQEIDLAPEVAEVAEPRTWMEAEVAQPQPLLATGAQRESVDVAVLTEVPMPGVNQQQVLAR